MEAAVKAGDADAEKLRGEIRLARPVFAGEKHLVCELV